MSKLLSDEQITQAVDGLDGWQRAGDALTFETKLATFPNAIKAVSQIGEKAEAADHHPDIDIRWRTLKFTLSTHSEGGITEKDVTLAGEINKIVGPLK
jgi:4a-hydroxytetrahydrobiopterin dehydratase